MALNLKMSTLVRTMLVRNGLWSERSEYTPFMYNNLYFNSPIEFDMNDLQDNVEEGDLFLYFHHSHDGDIPRSPQEFQSKNNSFMYLIPKYIQYCY